MWWSDFSEAKFFSRSQGGGVSFATRGKNATKGWTLEKKTIFNLSVCLFVCMFLGTSDYFNNRRDIRGEREGLGENGSWGFCTSGFRVGWVWGKNGRGRGRNCKNFWTNIWICTTTTKWVRSARTFGKTKRTWKWTTDDQKIFDFRQMKNEIHFWRKRFEALERSRTVSRVKQRLCWGWNFCRKEGGWVGGKGNGDMVYAQNFSAHLLAFLWSDSR